MKRLAFLVFVVSVAVTLIFVWRGSDKVSKVDDGFSQIEADLQVASRELREGAVVDRKTAMEVMRLADTLAEIGDTRQKQVADAAKKEVGGVLFGEESSTKAPIDSGSHEVVPFPGPLPEQHFKPLPLQSYVGSYAGTVAGRPVSFVVTITRRSLLGIRIVGLDFQPTMEFAEAKPQEFFQPDSKTAVVFADRTNGGFRTLYFLQNGVREKAENIAFPIGGSR